MNATVTYLADRRRTAAGGHTEPEHPCCWGIGGGRCCDNPNTRLYLCGWRCPAHTPAALNGRPEPDQLLAAWRAAQQQKENNAHAHT